MDVIDINMPQTIRIWLGTGSSVFTTLFVISYSTPVFLAVLVPLAIMYYFVQVRPGTWRSNKFKVPRIQVSLRMSRSQVSQTVILAEVTPPVTTNTVFLFNTKFENLPATGPGPQRRRRSDLSPPLLITWTTPR